MIVFKRNVAIVMIVALIASVIFPLYSAMAEPFIPQPYDPKPDPFTPQPYDPKPEPLNPKGDTHNPDLSKGDSDSGSSNSTAPSGSQDNWGLLDTLGYKLIKYGVNDFIKGQISLIGDLDPINGNISAGQAGRSTYSFLAGILRNGFGLKVDGKGWNKLFLDAWDGVDQFLGISGFVKWRELFSTLRNFGGSGFGQGGFSGFLNRISTPAAQVSKFAYGANIVGIVFNGWEFIYNLGAAYDVAGEADLETQADYNLKALAALGGVAMGAAFLIGGGPIALAVGGIGLAVWAFGTFGQYFTKNKTFARIVSAPMRAVKSGVNAVANAGKRAWNKVKSWFS